MLLSHHYVFQLTLLCNTVATVRYSYLYSLPPSNVHAFFIASCEVARLVQLTTQTFSSDVQLRS